MLRFRPNLESAWWLATQVALKGDGVCTVVDFELILSTNFLGYSKLHVGCEWSCKSLTIGRGKLAKCILGKDWKSFRPVCN